MKVSILIPSYNSAQFIRETILSAINQTYPNYEIIIVDDGSTDDSYSIANNFAGDNVKIHRQKNKGACAARNLAFKKSSGDYILFLDADDLISPNKLRLQMEMFHEYGNNIITSGQWGRFKDNIEEAQFPERFLDRDWENPIDWLLNSWEGKGMAQTSVWLTPRHLIEKAGPWDERLKVNQDGEFFSRVLLHADAIKFCKDAGLFYRSGNADSVSQIMSEEKAASLLLSYQLYKENVFMYEDSSRVRKALMKNFLGFVYRYYGKYPYLVSMAREEIKELGFNKLPVYGGRNFRLIANILGFDCTLKLRNLLQSIL